MAAVQETQGVHIDELSEFAILDPSELIPGTEVLLCHVPFLENLSALTLTTTPLAQRELIKGVVHSTVSSVLGRKPYAGEKAEDLLLFGGDVSANDSYRFLSDCGVLPYPSGYYNSTNFVVSLDELEAQGRHFIDTVSPRYEELRRARLG